MRFNGDGESSGRTAFVRMTQRPTDVLHVIYHDAIFLHRGAHIYGNDFVLARQVDVHKAHLKNLVLWLAELGQAAGCSFHACPLASPFKMHLISISRQTLANNDVAAAAASSSTHLTFGHVRPTFDSSLPNHILSSRSKECSVWQAVNKISSGNS